MSRDNRSVKATCVVSIIVVLEDRWASDTTMAQIIKQAEDGARGRIKQIFSQAGTDDKNLTCKRNVTNGVYLHEVVNVKVTAEES